MPPLEASSSLLASLLVFSGRRMRPRGRQRGPTGARSGRCGVGGVVLRGVPSRTRVAWLGQGGGRLTSILIVMSSIISCCVRYETAAILDTGRGRLGGWQKVRSRRGSRPRPLCRASGNCWVEESVESRKLLLGLAELERGPRQPEPCWGHVMGRTTRVMGGSAARNSPSHVPADRTSVLNLYTVSGKVGADCTGSYSYE